ncbi:MAG: hypothetical protein HY821_17080 [Acidobacteria bacterium]|nr:hypothetical protein [Acidobacteriota bacterium]
MKKRMLISAIALTAFLLPATAIAAAGDPCALVTKAEVQAAVGGAVSGSAVNKLNKHVCDFALSQAGSVLNVTWSSKSPADSAQKTVAELAKRNIKAEVVQGFGESGYRSSPGFGMQQLGAYKGSSHIIVTAMLMGAPEAKVKAALEAVMKAALARAQ